jgi:hypothetical protein
MLLECRILLGRPSKQSSSARFLQLSVGHVRSDSTIMTTSAGQHCCWRLPRHVQACRLATQWRRTACVWALGRFELLLAHVFESIWDNRTPVQAVRWPTPTGASLVCKKAPDRAVKRRMAYTDRIWRLTFSWHDVDVDVLESHRCPTWRWVIYRHNISVTSRCSKSSGRTQTGSSNTRHSIQPIATETTGP